MFPMFASNPKEKKVDVIYHTAINSIARSDISLN